MTLPLKLEICHKEISSNKKKKKKDRSFWIQKASGMITGSLFVEPKCTCIPWIGCSLCQGK